MRIRSTAFSALAVMSLVLASAACSDDDDTVAGPDLDRVYVQAERLGNPLVSEVTLAKRNHGFHNAGMPSTDVANHRAELRSFIINVAGRQPALADAIAGVLLPDMLVVQTNKGGNTAGWLTWALADGYGGRRLTDDVVDAGLAAIFGSLLNGQNVSPGLTTDNVSANDKAFSTTFPYLAAAN